MVYYALHLEFLSVNHLRPIHTAFHSLPMSHPESKMEFQPLAVSVPESSPTANLNPEPLVFVVLVLVELVR